MISTSTSVVRPPDYEARRAPAGAKIVAAELTRLVVVYRVNPQQWRDMSVHYVEALAAVPADVLHDAISQLVRSARSGEYFPRPGDILALCHKAVALLERAREDDDTWPQWLADIWGPLPDGPAKRAAALRGM